MRAAVLRRQAAIDDSPLSVEEIDPPSLGPRDILVAVEACGVCRTDLHVVEGDLPPVKMPVVPGHQVVGRVRERGAEARGFAPGDRVGIAWLRGTDTTCRYCRHGSENLCPNARFTGYTEDGGYAELAAVDAGYAYAIPHDLEPLHAAPLLCAGIIGYRALKRSGIRPGERLGLYGFGSSAHVAIQIALHWGCEVYVSTRGASHRSLAKELGALWVGDASDAPPTSLQAAVLFAPAGDLVPVALSSLDRGGTLAVAGIHLSDIPALTYERHLFYERTLTSVTANTREDGAELLELAATIPIRTHTQTYALDDTNGALQALKHDRVGGSAVVLM